MEIKDSKTTVKAKAALDQNVLDVKEKVTPFKDNTPAHWSITPVDTGVYCINTTSGEKFEGSISDFNKLLRG